LSPQQAWHGVRQWKLHLLVLATTFVAFPLLGLAARVLVPSVLTRHAVLTKVVDRGSILLIVYAAFSVGMAENIWSSVRPWRVVAVAAVSTLLLAIVLVLTWITGRLARLDRGDAIVLLFCGSKKSLASGLPMALVLFPPATVGLIMLPLMLFHQIQLFVCAVIASRLGRGAPQISSG
jgi:sodium/bile acid cotransporter 7